MIPPPQNAGIIKGQYVPYNPNLTYNKKVGIPVTEPLIMVQANATANQKSLPLKVHFEKPYAQRKQDKGTHIVCVRSIIAVLPKYKKNAPSNAVL